MTTTKAFTGDDRALIEWWIQHRRLENDAQKSTEHLVADRVFVADANWDTIMEWWTPSTLIIRQRSHPAAMWAARRVASPDLTDDVAIRYEEDV